MRTTLFPDPLPNAVTVEPPVWIRRIVFLRQIEPNVQIIREEIPFELGLNLIVTQQPDAASMDALGHDVGKTLLTRVIRYLLGEPKCMDTRTRTAVRREFPDSVVAGEFRVGGEDWSVMRPFGAPLSFLPRARKVNGWRDLLNVEGDEAEFIAFLQQVEDSVLASVSSPLLTNARRPIQWLDVLAWIARDQKCRYAHPLQWRHPDTDSGNPALHIEDASTVLRSVCGLMDAREKVLFEEHDDLLRKRQAITQEKALLERQNQAEEPSLTIDLRELLKSPNIGISELELQIVRDKANKQKELKADEVRKLNIQSLRTAYKKAVRAIANAEAQEKAILEQIDAATIQIKKRIERPLTVFEQFAAICDKPIDDCPAKLKISKQQVPAPAQDVLSDLKIELEDYNVRLAEVRTKLPELRKKLETSSHDLDEAEDQLTSLTGGIDGLIALYDAMERRVERHIRRMNRLAGIATEYESFTTQINQSSTQQNQLRDALAASREWMPKRFAALCTELIGGQRKFELAFEAKAIRLNIAGATGAPGEAMSTSALVLSLDLAAIQSAIDGYGHHPRLMILDSPREADMEIGIFNRLMRRIATWHKASPKPSFQMIVTTTTKPQEADVPSALIRAELARVPAKKLLLGVEL